MSRDIRPELGQHEFGVVGHCSILRSVFDGTCKSPRIHAVICWCVVLRQHIGARRFEKLQNCISLVVGIINESLLGQLEDSRG